MNVVQFQSLAEVDAWLDHERIECLECHKLFEHLGRHLPLIHAMTAEEFRAKYGIPHNRGLVGSVLRDRMVERQTRIMATDLEHRQKFIEAKPRKPYSVHPVSPAHLGHLRSPERMRRWAAAIAAKYGAAS